MCYIMGSDISFMKRKIKNGLLVFGKIIKRQEQFLITFVISYILTIVFTLIVALGQFDTIMSENSFKGNMIDFIKNPDWRFDFGGCTDISLIRYLEAKVIESLIPTTLTFCVSILTSQTSPKLHSNLNAVMIIVMVIFALVGVFFMLVKNEAMLVFFMWLLLLLFISSIVVSSMVFSKGKCNYRKEQSDGKLIGD